MKLDPYPPTESRDGVLLSLLMITFQMDGSHALGKDILERKIYISKRERKNLQLKVF